MSSAKLSVTFLGTSSAAPTKDRGLPSIAVRREGQVILMDCGEGVQRKVLAHSVGLGKDMVILVTHLHGDHVTGILGLLQTMSLAQRRKPVDVVAPAKLLRWLEVTSELLNFGLTFPIRFKAVRPGVVLRTPEFKVRAARAVHSVEAFSYLVEENDRPGVPPRTGKGPGRPRGEALVGAAEGEVGEGRRKERPPIRGCRPSAAGEAHRLLRGHPSLSEAGALLRGMRPADIRLHLQGL